MHSIPTPPLSRWQGYMERVYGSDESRFFLKKTADSVYSATIETGLELYVQTKDTTLLQSLFRYIENSKASVFHAGVSGLELSSLKGMPVVLLNRERTLKGLLGSIQFRFWPKPSSRKASSNYKKSNAKPNCN